ncbi:MAG: glycosyltransferase family 1 protein [Gemmatimonadales bacterium]|nr:MAG: glycosyltransferase family 1 protein [Gemmatimonadales bacterium]
MRVVVDARMLRSGGIGRYLREIVGRWITQGYTAAGELELRLLGHPGEMGAWLESLGRRCGGEGSPPRSVGVEVIPWTDPIYSPQAHLRWLRHGATWTRGAQALFFPHWDAPTVPRGPPRVTTVHDLTQFLEPEGFPGWKRAIGRTMLRRAVNGTGRVLTVSGASREDLVRWFPDVAPWVTVIENGVDHGVFHPGQGGPRGEGSPAVPRRSPEFPEWTDLQPYLLVVGPFKPHKGYATALEVLHRLREHAPGLRLVQVGPPEVRDEKVAQWFRDPTLAARVTRRQIVNDRELNQAYRDSLCLLHPARREGFGLPPLEAMAAGTPALVAARSSLPEVVGSAGLLLDPDDPSAWAHAVRRLLAEPEWREEWIRKGRARAAAFSWDRSAQRTLAAIREAVAVG